MKRIFFLFLTLYAVWTACAQPSDSWQDALREWLTAEEVEEGYGEETMELLQDMADARLNLNQTTREELEQLPFLSALQVEELVEYVYRYGPLRSPAELQMVTSLDYQTRRLLQHFVYVGQEQEQRTWPRLGDVAKYGRHTLTATARVPCYDRRGDKNGYLGYKYRHDVRYQFNYHDRIKFGITGAQDAGEPFLANKNSMGYDHYAYYVQLRNMGRLEALNVGTYRVQMGMGLVMNTSFGLGKLATLQSLGRSTHTLSAHASRSGSGYMQGAAASVRLGDCWHVTAFASYRALDATLNADGTARTLLTDGYHRTPTELAKKNNTHETDLGLRIGLRPTPSAGTVQRVATFLNLNMVYTHLDRPLHPQTTTLYRRYAATGSDFLNASLDYGYTSHRLSVAGETALNQLGALSMLHTASYRLTDEVTLMALHRYYGRRYTALHGRSFGEGSSVQNEHGLYAGATWQPSRSWLVQGYVDYAHFGWPRYQVTAKSDALDMLLSARHTHRQWTLEGRYRMHLRQRDNSAKTHLMNRPEHRLRLRATCTASPLLTLQTQGDAVRTRIKSGGYSHGVMLSQHATLQWRWLKADGHVGWFRTDDYDARVYQYERSVSYDFSFPMYYGHGLRYAVMASAQLGHRLTATARLGTTNYFDRSVISSGLQQIAHSSMTDVQLQVRCQL